MRQRGRRHVSVGMLTGLVCLVLTACGTPGRAPAGSSAFGPLLPSGPLVLTAAAPPVPLIELDVPDHGPLTPSIRAIERRLLALPVESRRPPGETTAAPWHAAEHRLVDSALRLPHPDLMPGRYGLELFGRGRLQLMLGSQMMLENKMLDHLVLDPDEMDRNASRFDADIAVFGLRLPF